MATMTIVEQPANVAYSRSPMLYLVQDATAEKMDYTDYNYLANVYIWIGLASRTPATPTYSLAKPRSSVANGAGASFDISSLLADKFVKPAPAPVPNDDAYTQTLYCWVMVKFGFTYIDDLGVTQTTEDDVTSNKVLVLPGYNYYGDGINHNPATTSKFWLTDKPLESDIPKGSTITLFFVKSSIGTTTKIKTKVNGVVGATETIASFYFDLVAISYTVPLTTAYLVEIYGTDDLDAVTTPVYTFNVIDPCLYGYMNIQFLNRYGVWDNIFMYGSQYERLAVEKSEVFVTPLTLERNDSTDIAGYKFDEHIGQFVNRNFQARESLTINTGWIKEEWNAVIKQLFLSTNLLNQETLSPMVIKSTEVAYKTWLNDRLFNYTIEIGYAYSAINTVS